MSFVELGLSQPILRAIVAQGYSTPTPIQLQAIPHVLKGRDLLGCAQTGTGKTAAFAWPILHKFGTTDAPQRAPEARNGRQAPRRPIRSLVLAPTRELAAQIGEFFQAYGRFGGLFSTVIYGGVGQNPQVRALRQGVDVLIATPGRLLDLMHQGHVDLGSVEILVLDEGDQMLDMGFLPALKRIVAEVPRRRQTLLFSATMPAEIRRLADDWLRTPVEVTVMPAGTPAEQVEQSVMHVEPHDKPRLLVHYLLESAANRTLVFTRTKHGADKVVRKLEQCGIRAAAIHGNKSQNQRQRALDLFRSERPPVLVATDIAARGLDIIGVSHVINYDMPLVPELYVHRIGRTGRAGADGIAVSLCGRDERQFLRQIERLTRRSIQVASYSLPASVEPTAVHVEARPAVRPAAPTPPKGGFHGRRPTPRRPQRAIHRSGR